MGARWLTKVAHTAARCNLNRSHQITEKAEDQLVTVPVLWRHLAQAYDLIEDLIFGFFKQFILGQTKQQSSLYFNSACKKDLTYTLLSHFVYLRDFNSTAKALPK